MQCDRPPPGWLQSHIELKGSAAAYQEATVMEDAATEDQAAVVAALQLDELLEAPHSGVWKVAASCSFLGELRGVVAFRA